MSSYKQRKNKQKLLSVAAGYSPSALASGKTLILLRGSRHRPTPGAYRSSGHSAPTNLAPKACPFVVRLLSALELEIVEDGELVPAELRAAEHGNTEFAALVVAERQARVRWSSIRSAWISAGVLRF